MSKLFLPQGYVREVPESFAAQLKSLDPNLIVCFNPHKQRWVIDRCTRDGAMKVIPHTHTPECPRTNVIVVRDGAEYMPLCDAVLDQLRGMDSWRFGTVEAYQAHNATIAAADEAKRSAQNDDNFRHSSQFNRRQLMKAYDLTQIHDTARVNQ